MRRAVNHDSPTALRQFLEEEGLAPSRRFGQNFLVNPQVRKRILELLELEEGSFVWEIGPGLGAMSEALAERCRKLTLFEIDHSFAAYLRERFFEETAKEKNASIQIVEGDVIATWKGEAERGGYPDRIIGNLPYNAAAKIIASFLEEKALVRGAESGKMVFTVQKEVGNRMQAGPGDKDYSSFSLLCALYCDVHSGGDVAPGSFYPVPRVTSTVVVLEPHNRYPDATRSIAVQAVRNAFSSRRKTLRNALKGGPLAERIGYSDLISVLESAGIDPGVRGETLSVEAYAAIAEEIQKL